jgi:predicted HTH domain antitoxin
LRRASGTVFVLNLKIAYIYIMTTMTLQVPEALEKEHDNTVKFLAAKLYEAGKLNLRQAAEMSGMKKWDFAEILIDYGVHYLDQSALEDLETFRKANAG